MSELSVTDPCSAAALLAAAQRAYSEARALELRPNLERTAHACAALRVYPLAPTVEPAPSPDQLVAPWQGEEPA
jgi:hypothetical protein